MLGTRSTRNKSKALAADLGSLYFCNQTLLSDGLACPKAVDLVASAEEECDSEAEFDEPLLAPAMDALIHDVAEACFALVWSVIEESGS